MIRDRYHAIKFMQALKNDITTDADVDIQNIIDIREQDDKVINANIDSFKKHCEKQDTWGKIKFMTKEEYQEYLMDRYGEPRTPWEKEIEEERRY